MRRSQASTEVTRERTDFPFKGSAAPESFLTRLPSTFSFLRTFLHGLIRAAADTTGHRGPAGGADPGATSRCSGPLWWARPTTGPALGSLANRHFLHESASGWREGCAPTPWRLGPCQRGCQVRVGLGPVTGRTHSNTQDAGWTYVGHHCVLGAAGSRLGGLWVPAPGQKLHPALQSTGFCPVLAGSVGENSGDA